MMMVVMMMGGEGVVAAAVWRSCGVLLLMMQVCVCDVCEVGLQGLSVGASVGRGSDGGLQSPGRGLLPEQGDGAADLIIVGECKGIVGRLGDIVYRTLKHVKVDNR